MQTGGLCAHILVFKHVSGSINLQNALRLVKRKRGPGRPQNAVPALFLQPESDRRGGDLHPSGYIGLEIATTDEKYPGDIFQGTVVDARRAYDRDGTFLGFIYEALYQRQGRLDQMTYRKWTIDAVQAGSRRLQGILLEQGARTARQARRKALSRS